MIHRQVPVTRRSWDEKSLMVTTLIVFGFALGSMFQLTVDAYKFAQLEDSCVQMDVIYGDVTP